MVGVARALEDGADRTRLGARAKLRNKSAGILLVGGTFSDQGASIADISDTARKIIKFTGEMTMWRSRDEQFPIMKTTVGVREHVKNWAGMDHAYRLG